MAYLNGYAFSYGKDSDNMKILIICGHGAGDNGACAKIGLKMYKEATETRTMGKKLRNQLLKYKNVTVDLYPTSRNAYEDIKNGKRQVNFALYDYIIELHFNACVQDLYGNGKTTGTEIFVTKVDKTTKTEELIVKGVASVGLKNRGVKKSNFTVIYNAYQKCSVESALLEICFIDDADDMKIYVKNKDKIAKKIAKAIATSYKLKLKSDNSLAINDKIMIKSGAKDLNSGKKYSDFVYGTVYTVIRVDNKEKVAFGLNGITVGYTKISNVKEV